MSVNVSDSCAARHAAGLGAKASERANIRKMFIVRNASRSIGWAKRGGIDIAAELRRRYFFPVVGS